MKVFEVSVSNNFCYGLVELKGLKCRETYKLIKSGAEF